MIDPDVLVQSILDKGVLLCVEGNEVDDGILEVKIIFRMFREDLRLEDCK